MFLLLKSHIILFLHLLIIACLVLMVIFFRGIAQHVWWIFLGATVLFMLSAFIIFRRIKSSGKECSVTLKILLLYQGRGFEVSFLRGLVSLNSASPLA